MQKWLRLVIAGLAALLIIILVAVGGIAAYPIVYNGRIYPGVSVRDVDVGGLTQEEAIAVLAASLPDPAAQVIQLRADEHLWQLSWADAGMGFDYTGMAAAAYQVARQGPWYEQVSPAWDVRSYGYSVGLMMVQADPAQVTAALEALAPTVLTPPMDAQLQIGPGGAMALPGQAGRALDVEASAARVLQALADEAAEALSASEGTGEIREVELVVTAIPARLSEPEPAYTLAHSLLAQPFTLVADDPLTDYYTEFTASPEKVATWLLAVPEHTSDDARIGLEVDEETVQVWLLEVEPQLGPERLLDIGETLMRMHTALTAGQSQAQARIRHPQTSYVVQPGDNMFDIAYSHGLPLWQLKEANPDIDPEGLVVGMELVMPSIDILFPEPLVPGKRIEINLPEQRLRAYEGDEMVFEFTCSSGMSSTPTIAGQFQVLFKEPSAYASKWDLEMPYFLAVYQEGPEFFNGIHELPIRSNGSRLWASVLGWPASYGCIILNVGDAEALYDWAPVGTLVRIIGTAPGTPTYEASTPEEE
jgi:lipoprotein-anchoring transpeptidase ErfK/SrfK